MNLAQRIAMSDSLLDVMLIAAVFVVIGVPLVFFCQPLGDWIFEAYLRLRERLDATWRRA
jgi:hypothetical protein